MSNNKIFRVALQGKNMNRVYEVGKDCNGHEISEIQLWNEEDGVLTYVVKVSSPSFEDGEVKEGARIYYKFQDGSWAYVEYSHH